MKAALGPSSSSLKAGLHRPVYHSFASVNMHDRNMSLNGPMGSLPLPSFIQNRFFSGSGKVRSLNIDNINQNVRKAEYAVRGELAVKSEQYRAQLGKGEGKDLPFDSVISANIGMHIWEVEETR